MSAFVISGSRELHARLRAIADGKPMMQRVAVEAVFSAKALVPRKTGNLARTIRIGTITATSLEIAAGGQREVGYAAHVEFGTRGGTIIRPKRAKVLAWGGPRRLSGSLRSGGKPTHFAMRVRRGATRAQPYLIPGLEFAVGRITAEAIIDAWNDAA